MRRRPARVLFSLLLLAPCTCSAQQQEPLKKVLSGYIREEGTGHIVSEARIELQNGHADSVRILGRQWHV